MTRIEASAIAQVTASMKDHAERSFAAADKAFAAGDTRKGDRLMTSAVTSQRAQQDGEKRLTEWMMSDEYQAA